MSRPRQLGVPPRRSSSAPRKSPGSHPMWRSSPAMATRQSPSGRATGWRSPFIRSCRTTGAGISTSCRSTARRDDAQGPSGAAEGPGGHRGALSAAGARGRAHPTQTPVRVDAALVPLEQHFRFDLAHHLDRRLRLRDGRRAPAPKSVAAVEAANFAEWRRSSAIGLRGARIPRRAGQPRFVVERVQVVGWMSLVPGGGGRPHTLGVMAGQPPDLWPAVLQRSLAYVAQHHPGPVWCSLRHYDEAGIRLLRGEGFEVIASQTLMVRELPLKVPARMRVRVKDKRLVPQYG